MSTVAAQAKLILSGCSMEANRLHTTAATTTAVGPFGQAVANQKAEVIADGERGADPGQSRGYGIRPKPVSDVRRWQFLTPLEGRHALPKSSTRKRDVACSSAARTSADTTAPSSGRRSFASADHRRSTCVRRMRQRTDTMARGCFRRPRKAPPRPPVNSRSGWSRTRASALSKNADCCIASTSTKSLAS